MNMINDGGPAFPQSEAWGSMHPVPGGKTLRDYFAAKAMQAAIYDPLGEIQHHAVAEFAYRMADAMLRARENTNDR